MNYEVNIFQLEIDAIEDFKEKRLANKTNKSLNGWLKKRIEDHKLIIRELQKQLKEQE